jgi:hypothetical protein
VTSRLVVVIPRTVEEVRPPPGVPAANWALALGTDVAELLDDMELVTAYVLERPGAAGVAAETGLPVVVAPSTGAGMGAGSSGVSGTASVTMASLAASAAAPVTSAAPAPSAAPDDHPEQAAVVAGDAPDLPPLLIAKLFRSLGRADVAVCPADGGGAVALAARLPPAAWVVDADPDLDEFDVLSRLRVAAPRSSAVFVGPGWHRLRAPGDVAFLDPNLEGWPETRRLLSAARRS